MRGECRESDSVRCGADMAKGKVAVLITMSFSLFGCGRGYIGVYSGTETFQQNGITTSAPVTLNITEDTGSRVSGNWTGPNGSGTLTGTSNGAGSLANVTLLVTGQTTSALTYGGVYPTTLAGCSNTYTGNLNLNRDRISGTLSSSNNTYAYCTGTRSIDASR